MDFTALLDRFATAVAHRDLAGFAALFSPDGIYDDYFFGPHTGREAIAHMLDRFYVGGESFCWEFTEPLCDGHLGYARYCFSYRSKEPESAGQVVGFEGTSRFRFDDQGLITHYAETFDRGSAFTALGYAEPRVAKLLGRYAKAFLGGDTMKRHLALRTARGCA